MHESNPATNQISSTSSLSVHQSPKRSMEPGAEIQEKRDDLNDGKRKALTP